MSSAAFDTEPGRARSSLGAIANARLMVVLIALVTSCSSGLETSTDTTSSTAIAADTTQPDTTLSSTIEQSPTETATAQSCVPSPALAAHPAPLLELLRYVPNEDAYREAVRFNDVARFNNDRGLDLPARDCDEDVQASVSYTHLTLPTILLV